MTSRRAIRRAASAAIERCDVQGCHDGDVAQVYLGIRLCRRHWQAHCGPDGNGDRRLPLKRGRWPAAAQVSAKDEAKG